MNDKFIMRFEKIQLGVKANKQRGAIVVATALWLIMLMGFAAIAIDIGYLLVVRNELQNAADAAALSGAGYLYSDTTTPPNWSLATTNATSAISLNKADNAILTSGVVGTGYWNASGSPNGLQPTSITPTVNDLPGVQVTVNKTEGSNGGPISTFFAKVLGIASVNAGASAVAVVSSPGYTTESLFPIAVPECMFDAFWDSATGQPRPVTTSPLSYTFTLGSSYHYPGCGSLGLAGQWTTFDLDANDTTTVRNLIEYATGAQTNPDPPQLGIGDTIWIEPGVHNSLYANPNQPSVNNCSAAGNGTCEYVVVPVVCPNSPSCDNLLEATHSEIPITGFACLHILNAVGGSTKTISVEMVAMGSVPQCKISGSGGIGPNYGVIQPPRLANYYGNAY